MGIERIKNSYNNLDLPSMNELLSRNNQIAAYIDSLGSSIPGEEQQSVLLSMGGLTGTPDNSVSNCGVNCVVNCADNCGDCINTTKCELKINERHCENYSGSCTGSSNGGKCINSKDSYKPPTNFTWPSCG